MRKRITLIILSIVFPCSAQLKQEIVQTANLTSTDRQPYENKSLPTMYPTFLDFVGAGDLQQSVSSGANAKASTGAGIIFERYNGTKEDIENGIDKIIQSLEMEAVINIASTADTIVANFNEENELMNRRDFGNFLLYPVGKKQSLYFNANVYFGYPEKFSWLTKIFSGANFRILTSNNTWKNKDQSVEMGVLSFRAGLFHEFIPDNMRLDDEGRSKYSFFLGANFAYRGIIGDINSTENKTFRQNLLGSTETDFRGVELNLGFRLYNLRFEFQMPIFRDKNSISGLTDTQFLYTVRFVGGFPMKLNKEKPADSVNE